MCQRRDCEMNDLFSERRLQKLFTPPQNIHIGGEPNEEHLKHFGICTSFRENRLNASSSHTSSEHVT